MKAIELDFIKYESSRSRDCVLNCLDFIVGKYLTGEELEKAIEKHVVGGLLVESANCSAIAKCGDYIVRNKDGELHVYKPEMFKEMFEIVE